MSKQGAAVDRRMDGGGGKGRPMGFVCNGS